MSKWKIAGIVLVVLTIPFGAGLYSLGMFKFFGPKQENIRREIFEETKSYVHGKVQDLAKYYEEFQAAEPEDRDAIRSLIQMRFAEFDESNIRPAKLRNFLSEMRGY